MHRQKKGPMYESSTSACYDFIDFASPTPVSQPPSPSYSPLPSPDSARETQIIKKIESLYKSQLLNIEELREEDNHAEDLAETYEESSGGDRGNGKDGRDRVLADATNNYQPFFKIMRLDTYQTLGTGEDFQDEIMMNTLESIDSKAPFHNAPFQIRRSKTFIHQIQNTIESQPHPSPRHKAKPQPIVHAQPQPIVQSLQKSQSSYFSTFSEFTSDDLINMMPDPYRSSLQSLKRRVKNKSLRVL